MAEAKEGFVEQANLEGTESLIMFHQSATSGWSVAIGIPKAVMLADIRRWMWWVVGGTVLFLLGGLALARFLAHRIAWPWEPASRWILNGSIS
jgi:hypothetical protein